MSPRSQLRSARSVAVVVACALVTLSVSLTLTPEGASAQTDPENPGWNVTIWGTTVLKSTRIGNDPDTEFHSLSVVRIEGQTKFLFDIAADGSIQQSHTQGLLYVPEPTWHLEGSYDGVAFNCDPPMRGESTESTITGTATEQAFTFTLDLPDAREYNEEMQCSENFTAFATETHDLRDSLLFCGEVVVPAADYAEKSCKKSQIFFEDMSSPTSGRIKREITHDWFLALRNRHATQSPGSTPTDPASPSPSPSPEPRPSPTDDGPSNNPRASLMVLERHLRASGAVALAGWGDDDCVAGVPVRVQRRRADGSWATVKTVQTDETGLWSTAVGDRAARYRALAPQVTKGQAVCRQAVSAIKRHRHRG